jgi:hypothetical protein
VPYLAGVSAFARRRPRAEPATGASSGARCYLAAMPQNLSFDIELADVLELAPGEDLNSKGPFKIACAAAFDGTNVTHWYGRDAGGKPAPHMTASDVRAVLVALRAAQKTGTRLLAWNGLAFDLRWMGAAAEDMALAREIALELYDPLFQLFVERGFPVALEKVAQGFGLPIRKLMSGADAPKEWAAGNHSAVLEYVGQDCRITDLVCVTIESRRALTWITAKGRPSSHPMPKLVSVRELLTRPEPDTSWMDAPIPRSKFAGWLAD